MPLALAKLRAEGRQLAEAAVAAKQPVPPAPLRTAQPLTPLTVAQEKSKRRHALAVARKRDEDEHLELVVAAAAARGVPQPVSAVDRLAALRTRVLAKGARVGTGSASSQ